MVTAGSVRQGPKVAGRQRVIVAIIIVTLFSAVFVKWRDSGQEQVRHRLVWYTVNKQTLTDMELDNMEDVDLSMNTRQLRKLISETLHELELHSDGAVELLMLTAAAESNLGEYIEQTKGPAVGIFQMEPTTFADIMGRWLDTKPDLREKVEKVLMRHVGSEYDTTKHGAKVMRYNIKAAIIAARLHYLARPGAIPSASDSKGLAEYWKKNWNTNLGKGTVIGAMRKYQQFVDDMG